MPINIPVRHREDNLPNVIIREAHLEQIKLRHFSYRTPTVVFPSPLCITDVQTPPPWTSGGGHPFPKHPPYLIFIFARGKFFREAVLILNLNAMPSELSNIFLVCSSDNIVACVLIWSSCFLVVVGLRSARKSVCGCNLFVFKRFRGVLVYSKVVFTYVEFDPVIDIEDATFIRNLILPRNAKQLFSSHDYSFQAQLFVVVRPLLSDLRAWVEEPFLGRSKGSYSFFACSPLKDNARIMSEYGRWCQVFTFRFFGVFFCFFSHFQ